MDPLIDDEGKIGKGFTSTDELEAVDIGSCNKSKLTYKCKARFQI